MSESAVELIQMKLKDLYKEIEMNRTHAVNYRQQAKDYDEKNAILEQQKAGLVAALEKLKS